MAYHSAGREESARRTRTAILVVARRSFVDHGWVATTIRGVATEAGVSPESVYKNFSGKAGLLKAVYDTMLAGDENPLTIAERPEVATVRAASTPDRAASAYGSLAAVLAARTQPLMAVVVQARGSDPALDEFAAGLDAERRAGTAAAVRHWHSCGWVAAGQVEAATDVVWTLNSPAVRSMLRSRGWEDEAYARWIADCIGALVFGLTPCHRHPLDRLTGMTTAPTEPTGPPEPEMIARVEGRLGHLTLNRPGKMNALSITLIAAVRRQLEAWADDDAVEVVLIDGAGERGFCAGGDVRQLRDGIVSGTGPASFFEDEYTTNALIAHYPKPYVPVMDGVTMGGGVGLSAHGNVRVVTERSMIAMPETGIGLFPDVGALYLLARIPGGLGTHLALTGARLDGPAAIAAGLADHWMPSVDLPRLIDALAGGCAALEQVAWPEIPVAADTPAWIDECYSADRVPDILTALDAHGDPGAASAAATIRAVSPTAVTVTLAAIRRARDLDVDGVLAQDMVLVHRFLAEPDLAEGIRAQVVDKDRTPRWNPPSLDAVDDAVIESFFG